MSTLLQTYEEDFKESAKKAEEEINCIKISCRTGEGGNQYAPAPLSGAQSRTRRCAEVDRLIAHLRELLGNMQYESHDVPASQRQTLGHRMAEYQNMVSRLETGLEEARAASSAADRRDLLGGASHNATGASSTGAAGGEDGDLDEEHRRIMLDNTEKFRDASSKLNQAERLLNDTELVGGNALDNLRQQTEQLQNLHEVTVAVDDEISESRKVLQQLHSGMIKQKATLIAIAIVLVILIIVAIWVSVAKHRSTAPATAAPVVTAPPVDPTYSTPAPSF